MSVTRDRLQARAGRNSLAALASVVSPPNIVNNRIAGHSDRLPDRMGLSMDRHDLYEALIANSPDAIISQSLQGVITSWNRAAEAIFGYSEQEMIGFSPAVLAPDDALEAQAAIVARISEGGRPEQIESVRRHRNGGSVPVWLEISPICDRHGSVIGVSTIARDITGQIKTAQALSRAEQRYELVLAGMSVGVWDWDLASNEMYWSRRIYGIVGEWEGEAKNLDKFMDRLHPDDRQMVDDHLQAHLEKRAKFDIVYRLRIKNGDYAWIHTTAQAAWDITGKPIRLAGSIEDITQRYKLERDLTDLVEKLKKTNKDLDEFAYAASHDLKAPLRVIDNTSQWLMEDLEPHLTPETRENMGLLRSRVRRMEKLLGDLLEYSRIGRTRDERFAEMLTGGELLDNILQLLSPEPGFSVQADDGFKEITVMRMPLQQVLMNLITNAIKHHHQAEGSVRLRMRDAGAMVEFMVEDDGPGIAPQFHDKMFEMFRTLKPRDHVEGSGMGLAMVRKNVEMVGGTITVESSLGQGARFRFTWPKIQPDPRVEA